MKLRKYRLTKCPLIGEENSANYCYTYFYGILREQYHLFQKYILRMLLVCLRMALMQYTFHLMRRFCGLEKASFTRMAKPG